MAHSDMNTDAKTIKMSGMNHTEGGWPEHVRTEMVEHKNKFIRFSNIRSLNNKSVMMYYYEDRPAKRTCSSGL